MNVKKNIDFFISSVGWATFIGLIALLIYTNFGPKRDFSIFLPLGFFEKIGLNQDMISIIKNNADKTVHFVAGLIYTTLFFLILRPFKRFDILFSKDRGPVLFLLLISLAELTQYLFRMIVCHITSICRDFYFSILDIYAGFTGCLVSLCFLWFAILLFNKKRAHQ